MIDFELIEIKKVRGPGPDCIDTYTCKVTSIDSLLEPELPGPIACNSWPRAYYSSLEGADEKELCRYIANLFGLTMEDSKDPLPPISYWHEGSLCTPGLHEIGQELA